MKKSNKILRISALILLLSSFVFSSTGFVYADEKKAEETSDSDKAKSDDAATDDKDKKKGKDGEEPECE